jgi:polyhydroxybutyrate depolymerase
MRRLALVAVAALALAACSGDDGGSSATDASTTAPPTADPTTTTSAAAAPEDVAAAPSTGCEGTGQLAAGDQDRTVTSGGQERTYVVHIPPAAADGEPLPVVVDYHGYSEGGEIHAVHSALAPFGDEQGFITVTPDSGYEVPRWDVGLDSDDVAMFGDMLDQVEAESCVDTNRVFVAGLSNGAFMTSSLACAHGDRIAAASPVAGITDPEGCAFDRPVPVIAFHGTEDTFVAFDGGLGSSVADLPQPDGSGTLGEAPEGESGAEDAGSDLGPSIPDVAAAWAERNGCEGEAAEESVADDVTLQAFPCPAGAETELYVVEGGGHTWPGSDFDLSITSIVGVVTMSIDANELMWAFFQAHPLPA